MNDKTTLPLRVKTEKLESRQLRLVVRLPEESVLEEMERTARRISRQVSFPGFRKGKAPYDMVVQRYGEQAIREETADRLTEQVYRQALEEADVTPYAPASLEELELEPLRYVFRVSLVPVVDLGNYRSLRVKPAKIRVKKDEINRALEVIREEHAMLEPAEGRGAQEGDALVISIEGRSGEGELFLSDDEVRVVLDLEDEYPAPGFYQELVGIMPEEERVFQLKLPEGIRVEGAEFTVHLKQLFDRTLPGLDDDLARTAGDFANLKELRKHLEERIREHKQAEADEEYSDRAVQALVDKAKIEYPPEALESEVEELVDQLETRVQREQRLSLPDYLRVVGKTEDEIREEFRPIAEERLRRNLALSEFVAAEELDASDEEIEQRAAELSESWGIRAEEARKQLQSGEGRQVVLNSLLVEKAVERLTLIASGNLGR